MEDYSYDSFGHRLGLTDTRYTNGQPETEQRYSYGYDVQGSVSLLLNEAGGARAAYGYTPYGKPDADLTKGDTDQTNPFNSYRYSAKRFDSGSGSLDMGARRFGPKPARFLLRDFYHGALADQRLSLDPLTQNRYGPAGGNPISFVEVDGHDPLDERWQQEFTQAHGREPEWYDESIRLFSIAYPEEWEAYGGDSRFYNPDGTLQTYTWTDDLNQEHTATSLDIAFQSTDQPDRTWAYMPTALNNLAGQYRPWEESRFVQDVGSLWAGLRTRSEANLIDALRQQQRHTNVYLRRDSSLSDEWTVAPHHRDPDANVHHWAAFFALGYAISGEAASRWNENREWEQAGRDPSRVDQSDILLGNAAAYMGGEMLAPWVGIGFSNIGSMLCTFVPIRGGGCG